MHLTLVGDSITDAYSGFALKRLPVGWTLHRGSSGGKHLLKIPQVATYSYWTSTAYTAAVDALTANHGTVVVMLGTNDGANYKSAAVPGIEQIYDDCVALVHTFRRHADQVFLMTPPRAIGHDATESALSLHVRPSVQKCAKDTSSTLLDVYQLTMLHPDWIGLDGIHFTDAGSDELAKFVIDSVTPKDVVDSGVLADSSADVGDVAAIDDVGADSDGDSVNVNTGSASASPVCEPGCAFGPAASASASASGSSLAIAVALVLAVAVRAVRAVRRGALRPGSRPSRRRVVR